MNIKIIITILLLILIGGAGVWYVLQDVDKGNVTSETPTEEQPAPEPYIDPFPNDTDRDGISNEEETALGLDTTEFDTDQDGLADAFELNGTNTDPNNKDTDGDTLSDGQEFLIWNTDPTKADTDGDGFDDVTEIENGFNPNGDGRLE